MTNTTALDLDRLEAVAKAATPGPWHSSDAYADNGAFSGVDICADDGTVLLSEDSGPGTKDAEFIAAANPAAILQLIANLRAALAAKGQQEPVTIGAGNPETFFAQFCDREGYPSDGEMDAALRSAFYAGIEYCAAPVAQQSEAGAPPAANKSGSDLTAAWGAVWKARALAAGWAPEGRESAAPAAPVREGDCEQDAKDAARYRWLRGSATDIGNVIDKEFAPGKWEYRAGEELDEAIDAAMQKGASNG